MSKFTPYLAVSSTGILPIGMSPHGTVSILSDGVIGVVGVFINGTFKPHVDGAIAGGEMFTYECVNGRELGIDVTSGAGTISTAQV